MINYLKPNGYITITPDAIQMGLKGNELLIYSLIAGFCRNGNGFEGSITYIEHWTNADRRTVTRTLAKLCGMGLIDKERYTKNNILRYRYRLIKKQSRGQA